jgi:hypothetical protein
MLVRVAYSDIPGIPWQPANSAPAAGLRSEPDHWPASMREWHKHAQ